MTSTPALAVLGLWNLAYRSALFLHEATILGQFAWWWRLRHSLARHWLNISPQRLVKREGPGSGAQEGDLIYGETPLITCAAILERVGAQSDDRLLDLGCGRGLMVLGAAQIAKSRARGIELLPGYVERATRVAADLGMQGVEFVHGDARQADLSWPTILFIAATTWSDNTLRAVEERLGDLPPGARVISLSAPLRHPDLSEFHQETLPFSWGLCRVHYQKRSVAQSSSASIP